MLAVALLLFGVREPDTKLDGKTTHRTNPIRHENLKRLGSPYWWVVGVGAVFTLARFSEAFLVLRAHQSGIALALVAPGDGGDEPDLCGFSLPVWQTL